MIKLNLKTDSEEYQKIKQYLEENVSETLADKINNGVKITKENKTLINKKDLDGFWDFATEEAKKLAKQGAKGKAIWHETVYAWAVHYFEEDSIEGKLYNEDGTEYKIPITTYNSKVVQKPQPKKAEKSQATLFDLLDAKPQEQKEVLEQLHEVQEEIINTLEPKIEIIENNKEKFTIDASTGEVLSKEQIENSFDKQTMYKLYNLLDGKFDMR